ncbi:methyltransferase [Clostridium felsineum]|uniref:Release factor glutamine methyltransferase n=1 Tax=Clostridium felsineum TaxID=36839 RepID=A0A1S8LSG9_9CLOT|nr:methyltransferase [Clostridium felsineum]URZ08013.1 Release factor glutamine methyltransferase [Clostridium felsineum]URZ13044.1 Release factor glutamine methyltransferase [Clostridium felsineum]
MISYDKHDLIKKFKMFLDKFDYDLIYQLLSGDINYFYNPWQTYDYIVEKLYNIEPEKRVVYKLLLLGDKVKKDDAISAMGNEIINILLELNIVEEDCDYLKSKGYSLISYCDYYFLVGTPYFYSNCKEKDPAVYIGADTYKLAKMHLSKKVGNVLDLCTGSGIQIVLAARNAVKGIGIELNPEAYPVTKFNILLNGLEDKIEIRNGDLYNPVKDLKFDVITSNPPFIPVPKDINYSLAGDGGEDGLDIVTRIVNGYKEHLNVGGYGLMIGEAIGDENGAFMSEVLQKILGNKFSGKLFLVNRITIEEQAKNVSGLTNIIKTKYEGKANEIYEKWMQMYKKLGATYYYSFELKVKKISENEKPKFEVITTFPKWTSKDKPLICKEYNVEDSENDDVYLIKVDGKIVSVLDKEATKLIPYMDGKTEISDMVNKINELDKENLVNKEIYFSKQRDIIEVCDVLEKCGVVERV